MRLLQARGFGVSSEKMSGTTHLKKGLRKWQWAAKVTGTFLFHMLRFWSRGYQASASMVSRDRGFHHLTHSEKIIKLRDRSP